MGMNNETWRQHVVSQALLNRFCDPNDDLIGVYDVRYGHQKPSTSKAIGFQKYFVKHEPDEAEKLWRAVEDRIAPAFREIDESPATYSPETSAAVKDLVALHYARSMATRQIHDIALANAERHVRSDTPMLSRLANLKHSGLHLEHAPGIHAEIAEEIITDLRAQLSTGVDFRDALFRFFEITKARLSGYSLMIRPAIGGAEFLLGDCPAVSVARGMNPEVRAPLLDAAMITMPLGPRSIAFVYPDGIAEATVPVDGINAVVINRGQLTQAQERVYHRRSSGLGAWAETNRPPRGHREQAQS
ncbi:DUF4238 domain-containing protein [Arthrobacter methylotrophus]